MRRWWILYIVLFLTSCEKQTDWSYSLNTFSTEPYGTYIAFNTLNHFYKQTPKYLADVSGYIQKETQRSYFRKQNAILFIVSGNFKLSPDESSRLYSYLYFGGTVFMAVENWPDHFDSLMQLHRVEPGLMNLFRRDSSGIYGVKTDEGTLEYPYHGIHSSTYFKDGNSWPYGYTQDVNHTSLMVRKVGSGFLYSCSTPEIFTNYFLLQGNNKQYLENILAYTRYDFREIYWYAGRFHAPGKESKNKGTLWELLKHKEYLMAFLVLCLLTLSYLFFQGKRRQREIKIIQPIVNDSLAFTETIGKLYYHEKDHKNLSEKMIRYYLEHIRTKYNLPTSRLDEEFSRKLAYKMNKPEVKVQAFVKYLLDIYGMNQLQETDIKFLYQQLKEYE